jgi:hypothetical protein
VRLLLAAGADLQARDACGNRPVHTAAWFGLRHDAPRARDATKDAKGSAEPPWLLKALDLAGVALDELVRVLHEQFDVVGELARAGANLAEPNGAGSTVEALGAAGAGRGDWD